MPMRPYILAEVVTETSLHAQQCIHCMSNEYATFSPDSKSVTLLFHAGS